MAKTNGYYFLHENHDVNCELNYFVQEKRCIPIRGNDTRNWRYSINMNTQSNGNDMFFSEQQYLGVREIIEHYTWESVRRKYKKSSSYEDFIYSDCWMVLSRMHDKLHIQARYREQQMKENFKSDPVWSETGEDWRNELWTPVIVNKISQRRRKLMETVDSMDNMVRYLHYVKKCAIDNWKFKLSEERVQTMMKIYEYCSNTLPVILPEEMDSFENNNDYFDYYYEDWKKDFQENEIEKLTIFNYAESSEGSEIPSITSEVIYYSDVESLDSRDYGPEMPDWSDDDEKETQGENSPIFCENAHFEDPSSSEEDEPMEIDDKIEEVSSDDEIDGNIMSTIVELAFQIPIAESWKIYINSLYKTFVNNSSFEPVDFSWLRTDRHMDNVIKQMQQCLGGSKANRYVRAALILLRHYKSTDKLHFPYQYVVNNLDFHTLCNMFDSFVDKNAKAFKIGLNGDFFHQFMLYSLAIEIAGFPDEFVIQNELEIQGDNTGEVLEAIENIDKTANVTLLHERPVNTVTAHHEDGASTIDKHNEAAESSYTLKQMLTRNIHISNWTWTTAQTASRHKTLILPAAFFNSGNISYTLMRNLAFARFDMHITCMHNGNKYTQGAVAVGIGPPITAQDEKYNKYIQDMCLPFGILQASVSNVVEFKVPFNNVYTYFSQQDGTLRGSDGWTSMGYLWFDIINPLKVPTGVASSIDIDIYARLENIELHQTVVPFVTMNYTTKFIDVNAEGAPENDLEVQGDDQIVINKSIEPLIKSNKTQVLDTSAKETISPDPQTYVVDELSFEHLFKIPSLLDTFEWNQTDLPGAKLWNWIVSPTYLPNSRSGSVTGGGDLVYPTMLSYLSRMGMYYDGDMILKFQKVANDFYSGRLTGWHDPHWVTDWSKAYTLNQLSNTNNFVIDLQQQNEFEIRVPFTSIKPLLRCDKFRTVSSPKAFLGEWHQGILAISVLTRLIGPPNNPGAINFNVYIYGAENFRICMPVPFWSWTLFKGRSNSVNTVYPLALRQEDNFTFAWKNYIYELYYRGANLYRYGMIVPDKLFWYNATTKTDMVNNDAFKWVFECSRIKGFVTDKSPLAKLALALPNYSATGTGKGILDTAKEILDTLKKWPKQGAEEDEAQGMERYVTTGDEHPIQITLTKNIRPHHSKVMDASHVSLRTWLERYFPLTIIRPIVSIGGYIEITVPVFPGSIMTQFADINISGLTEPGMSHVAWVSYLGNYWEGSLKYKLVLNRTDAEIIAVHMANVPEVHSIRPGLDEVTVQQMLSYGSDIEVSHLAGGMEVTVPFRSSFNQLIIPRVLTTPDLRFQNGTLKFFVRSRTPGECMQQIMGSIFIAIGKDFKLNWIKGPPTLYEPRLKINVKGQVEDWDYRETACPMTNDYPGYLGPLSLDHSLQDKGWVTQINFNPTPPPKPKTEEMLETQGVQDFVSALQRPNKVMQKVEAAATSIPLSLERISDTVEKTSQEFSRVSSEFSKQTQSVVEDVSSVKNNINQKLNSLNGEFHNLVDKSSEMVDTVSYYVNLTATTMLSGNVIRSFIKAAQNPGLAGSWIDLGISFAALLGFSIKHVIIKCVNSVLDWFHGNEQSQAQALSGASLNEIEENEETILKSVAVLGTILYAYIFECIPDFTNLKKMIKKMLTQDPETQGLNLRGAHFAYMGLTALSKVFDNIIHYTKKFLDWLLERDSPEALCARKAAHIQERIMKCIQDIDFYDNEYEILKALVDPDAHNKMYRIVDEANELTDIFMKEKLDPRIGQILTECRTRSKALVKRLETEAPSNGWRFDPYIIVIHGESGTGKSHIMHELMRIVADEWELPKYNRIYPKTVKDDFWSGYTGQPIIQWDEFGQNPENDKQAVELIELRSNLPKRLNMAALHEKGRYFNSKAMFITTNVAYIRYDANIRDDDAFKRRRHFMLEMRHKPGFDANVVQDLPNFDPTYNHCIFRRTSNMRPPDNEDLGWQPLDDIKQTIRNEVRAWYAKQMDLYADYMQNHGLGVIPRGVVHISAPVEVDRTQGSQQIMQQIASAAVSLTQTFVSDDLPTNLPNVTRYEDRNGQPALVTTPTGSTRPIHLEADGRDYNVTASALNPPEEKWGCIVQGDTEETPFASTESFSNKMYENEEFDVSSTDVSVGSPVLNISTLIEDRTGEALVSNWELHNILINHNQKPFSTTPVTQKEFMYVSSAVLSDEFKNLSLDEQQMARDFVEQQQPTIATYSVPPPKLKKAWHKQLWEKISIYYHKAKEIFQNIAQKIKDFFANHPKISIGFAILTALGAVAGTMWLIQQEAEPKDYEDATSRWNIIEEEDDMMIIAEDDVEGIPMNKELRVQRIVESGKHYELNQNRKGFRKVIAQGSEDPNALNIRQVVHPNLMVIGWPEGASKKCTMRCLHLRGRLILVPFHFFANAKEGESFVLCHRTVPLAIEFNKERMFRMAEKDFVLYDCGAKLEPRKDIVKYFISEKDLQKVPKCNVVLCNVEYDGTYLMMSGAARAAKEYSYKDNTSGDVYSQDGWEVNMSTSSGDCGSFLLGLCKSISGPGKILGIHTAGSKTRSCGFSVLITCEMLNEACRAFVGVVQGMPIPSEIDTSESALFKIVPQGDYSIYGVMPNHLSPAQPQRTTFQRTPFLDDDLKEISNLRKPAHLKPFTLLDGTKISPLRLALEKYGKVVTCFPYKDLLASKAHLLDIFKNNLVSPGFGIMTIEQAVLGIPGNEFAKPLNLKSAAGWPYQVLEKEAKGKFHLFNEEGKIVNKELQTRYDERFKAAKALTRVPSVWRDCLKDELRPNEKVDAGKSRLFTIAPVDFNILVRQYFMDFNVAFYSANCTFFSAVGIDPESMDWTRMYKYLAETGTNTIAGDYSSFDGTLMPDVMDAVCDVINEWYNDGETNANVRKTLVNEMIHTMQLVENTLYATHQGNPSGNPETVILNTCVGFMYLCLAFKRIYPDKSLADFRKYCRCIIYGDDLLATVKEEIEEFNQENLTKVFAERGITFTNEVKSEKEVGKFRELKEVSFLKRSFRKDKTYGNQFWLAAISEETLLSYFHWVRETPDVEEQLQQNMAACLRFAAFHGKEKYNWYLKKWQKCMESVGFKSITTTFEEQVDIFHGNVGILCRDKKFHQVLRDLTTEGDDEKVLATIEEKMEKPSKARIFCEVMWEVTKFAAGYWLTLKALEWLSYTGHEFNERNEKATRARVDNRCAACIPSGEGKTTLAKKHPKLFVDHDDYLLKDNMYKLKTSCAEHIRTRVEEEFQKPVEELNWFERAKLNQAFARMYESWVREHDAPEGDRRILLTHHPRNTKRQIIGCYILPEPTHIRQNAAGRKALEEIGCSIMTYEERENDLVRLAEEKEGLSD